MWTAYLHGAFVHIYWIFLENQVFYLFLNCTFLCLVHHPIHHNPVYPTFQWFDKQFQGVVSHFKSRNNLPFKLICIMTIINWGIWHLNAVKVSINWGTCFNQKLYIYLFIIWTDRQEAAKKSLNYYDYHCTSYCICDIILPKQIIALIYGLPVDIINVLF